jgi:phosphomethylpyrimidine synthase
MILQVPYTDPNKTISYRKGIDSIRSNWIQKREEIQKYWVESAQQFSNERLNNKDLDELRFEHLKSPQKG